MIHFRPQWEFVCNRRRVIGLPRLLGYLERIQEDLRP